MSEISGDVPISIFKLHVFLHFSAVRRGQSFKKSFFKETRIKGTQIEETDIRCRNVFHYAVSKPDTLKQLLENAETVNLVSLHH